MVVSEAGCLLLQWFTTQAGDYKTKKIKQDIWTDGFMSFHYFVNRKYMHTVQSSKGTKEEEWTNILFLKILSRGFPGGAVVKNPPANAGDTGSSPGPGRSHMLRSN